MVSTSFISPRKDPQTLSEIFHWVEFELPLERFLAMLTSDYKIGEVVDYALVVGGYQDLNIKLTTSLGKYFVKVFSLGKPPGHIEQQVQLAATLPELGIPFPKLYESSHGSIFHFSLEDQGKKRVVDAVVMEYIEGHSFNEITPTIKHMKKVIKYMSIIHSLKLKTVHKYDEWAAVNLALEFDKRKAYMVKEDLSL